MPEKLKSELFGVVGGAAVIENAPELTEMIFDELQETLGSDIQFMPEDMPNFENFYETGIDFAGDAALIGGVFLVMLGGAKYMLKGVKEKAN